MRIRRREPPAYRSAPAYLSAINCAGLLSALLVLLVQFMLWNPNHPWDPKLPEARHAAEQPDPSRGTLVTLSADGGLYVNRQPTAPSQLSELIQPSCEPAMRFDPYGGVLFVEADPELPYSSVAAVLELCRSQGGFDAVFLARRNISILDAWADGSFSTN